MGQVRGALQYNVYPDICVLKSILELSTYVQRNMKEERILGAKSYREKLDANSSFLQ